ncbi:MAG: cysteine--tRNA ligase [Candidatus Atabeyarchaeum deiterrae]
MTLLVYNTKSKQKENFEPLEDNRVKMYVCGPTVYDVPHIGHGRSYVFFDVVRRYLEFLGYDVTLVTNFTDTEASINKRAHELGKNPLKLADEMIEVFLREMDRLGVKRANYYPRVTQHIKEIIDMTERLIEMGYAYVVNDEVFFEVQKTRGYGTLVDLPIEELIAGQSAETGETESSGKRSSQDFALWRKSKPGEPSWSSPWGEGRPGWHIECSAMSTKYLGSQIDIQGGGTDLIFPHHESSSLICQTLFGKPFAKYYIHNGFITVNRKKMSKSLANFVTLKEVLKKYDHEVVRFFLLGKRYREQLEYDDKEMAKAETNLRRIQGAINKTIKTPTVKTGKECMEAEKCLINRLVEAKSKFIEAMNDDFNTEEAIKRLLKASQHIEEFTETCKQFTTEETGEQAKAICKQFNDVMGVCRKLK